MSEVPSSPPLPDGSRFIPNRAAGSFQRVPRASPLVQPAQPELAAALPVISALDSASVAASPGLLAILQSLSLPAAASASASAAAPSLSSPSRAHSGSVATSTAGGLRSPGVRVASEEPLCSHSAAGGSSQQLRSGAPDAYIRELASSLLLSPEAAAAGIGGGERLLSYNRHQRRRSESFPFHSSLSAGSSGYSAGPPGTPVKKRSSAAAAAAASPFRLPQPRHNPKTPSTPCHRQKIGIPDVAPKVATPVPSGHPPSTLGGAGPGLFLGSSRDRQSQHEQQPNSAARAQHFSRGVPASSNADSLKGSPVAPSSGGVSAGGLGRFPLPPPASLRDRWQQNMARVRRSRGSTVHQVGAALGRCLVVLSSRRLMAPFAVSSSAHVGQPQFSVSFLAIPGDIHFLPLGILFTAVLSCGRPC